ncbi:MAG: 50S ribosomal protein L3 [Armatimonadetes bacterium CG07_land_8_20_14_0_80_40_9]|nr:MAG: 50S ribosomal protein L3 [Armatimonadetes bacterium CG07_land_8_20_14_0_80_40_9]
MKAILGRKVGMTQISDPEGRVIPVTVIEAEPCVITQLKQKEGDGYNAIQIGWIKIKESRLTKPLKGHFAKAGVTPRKFLREVRQDDLKGYKLGEEIKADIFKAGDNVDVTGISKGKGFSGVMKRWHFKGGPASHGSMIHRKPMSIGATDAARVFKGQKMPGHLGDRKVTVQNLKVVKVRLEDNLLLIQGAVPGAKNKLLLIKEAVKS